MGLPTVLRGSFCFATLLLLAVGGEDCEVEILVRRNTVYDASAGESLRIECPVKFCNATPPTISWYRLNNASVLITPSRRINTEWRPTGRFQGNSTLIFQNALVEDLGVYQCKSDLSASHVIKVSVSDSSTRTPTSQDTPWPTVYRVVGIGALVAIVTMTYITTRSGCKGVRCAGRPQEAPDTSRQPSHHALPMTHIYENERVA